MDPRSRSWIHDRLWLDTRAPRARTDQLSGWNMHRSGRLRVGVAHPCTLLFAPVAPGTMLSSRLER
eukprot:1939761-Prymnesium_polylepis.1